jgi:hypothetical protein
VTPTFSDHQEARVSRSRAAVVATAAGTVLGLALTLAGCTSDSSDAGPEPSTSPSASSAAPTEDPSPSVTPASGPRLTMPNGAMNAPEGWKRDKSIVDFQVSAHSPDYISSLSYGALEYAGPTLPIDLQAKAVRRSFDGYERLPDQEIDGVTFLHYAGSKGKYATEDAFTIRDSGYETSIYLSLNKDMKPAEREETLAAVLASFQFG